MNVEYRKQNVAIVTQRSEKLRTDNYTLMESVMMTKIAPMMLLMMKMMVIISSVKRRGNLL